LGLRITRPVRPLADSFDKVFKSNTCKVKLTPIRSPNLQAHVERVIQTIKHEVLNAFCIVSDKHLNRLLSVTQDWYNHRRGHSARDHLPPIRDSESPPKIDLSKHKLLCVEELGGHLKSYHAAA
jgi:putative transposase